MKKYKKFFLPAVLLLLVGVAVFWLIGHDESKPQASNIQPMHTVQTKEEPQEATPPAFDKNKYSHDDVTSIWVVVNKQRPLNPKTYAPNDLVSVGGGQQMRQEAAGALKQLIAEAKAEGLTISPLSGYRSYSTQVSVYNNEVNTYGQAVADTESARPGTSEHQTGLAIDVGGGGCGIENCFGNTPAGKWVAANAYKYGFIVRYTTDKQQITGYRAEPWHIRYIGTELSNQMHTQGVTTLEEFFSLPAAPAY